MTTIKYHQRPLADAHHGPTEILSTNTTPTTLCLYWPWQQYTFLTILALYHASESLVWTALIGTSKVITLSWADITYCAGKLYLCMGHTRLHVTVADDDDRWRGKIMLYVKYSSRIHVCAPFCGTGDTDSVQGVQGGGGRGNTPDISLWVCME